MEEFFRKSLDKFNEDPSGNVWDDLDRKLAQDKPKGFFFDWLKYLLPATLLLCSFLAFSYYQMQVLEDYKKQISNVLDENKNLKFKLETKSESTESTSAPKSSGSMSTSLVKSLEHVM